MAGGAFEEKKASLTPLEYEVIVNKGTERAFSNKYNRHFELGSYHCIVCNQELFKSESKFESKSGFPAFSSVVPFARLKTKADSSNVGANLLFLVSRPDLIRTEVSCDVCGAHLGHLFKDGPKSMGGLRYCVNSISLTFVPTPAAGNNNSVTGQESSENMSAGMTPCGIGKICFFASKKDQQSDGPIQRISTTPRPLPILRETTL